MADDKITATCTKHNPPVALQIADENDDNCRVVCPECGADFGTWGEVKTALKGMVNDKFKDTPWISVK